MTILQRLAYVASIICASYFRPCVTFVTLITFYFVTLVTLITFSFVPFVTLITFSFVPFVMFE